MPGFLMRKLESGGTVLPEIFNFRYFAVDWQTT